MPLFTSELHRLHCLPFDGFVPTRSPNGRAMPGTLFWTLAKCSSTSSPASALRAFTALGARPTFTVGELGYQTHNAYQAIETGAITSAEFRGAFRQHLRYAAADSSIDHAWNALLLDLQPWLIGPTSRPRPELHVACS